MILWAAIAGMLVAMATFGPFGFGLGAIVGAMMGVWLRSIMAAEIARAVERRIDALQISHEAAACKGTRGLGVSCGRDFLGLSGISWDRNDGNEPL